ncbi:MAG TPA: hypothetical protein VK509_00930 [Polyangiales bacterium]|nr:hypothetical protein [Polyangiales bacterium]
MTRWHALWLVASFAISAGTNRAMAPHVEHELTPGQRTLVTGTLRFEGGHGEELKVVNVFVVAHDLRRVLAAPLQVRELLVRSAEANDGGEPDLELFFDFGDASHPIAADARDVAELRERDLPLLATGLGSEVRSRVRFPGAAAPAFAREGSLRIGEVYELADDENGATWRIEADVRLTLLEGGHERTVQGTLNARLTW